MQKDLKLAAETFLGLVAKGQVEAAFAQFIADELKHHNPYFRGDAQSLMYAMIENSQGFPQKTLEIKHSLQEGDLVAVHSKVRLQKDDQGAALVHIFRFEAGKIVELWDIGQSAPDNSPNQHGMF